MSTLRTLTFILFFSPLLGVLAARAETVSAPSRAFSCPGLFATPAEADERLFAAYVRTLDLYREKVSNESFAALLEGMLAKGNYYEFSGADQPAPSLVALLREIGRGKSTPEFDARVGEVLEKWRIGAREISRAVERATKDTETIRNPVHFLRTGNIAADFKMDASSTRGFSASVNGRLQVWDLRAHLELRSMESASKKVAQVEADSGLTRGLTESQEGILELWDLEKGMRLYRMDGLAARRAPFQTSADFSVAVTGDADGFLTVWDLATGEKKIRFKAHGDSVTALKIDEKGARAISGGEDGYIRVWDLKTGAEIQAIQTGRSTWSLESNEEMTFLVYQSENHIVGYDLAKGKLSYEFGGVSKLNSRSFRVNSKFTRAVGLGGSGNLISWNPKTGKAFEMIELPVPDNRATAIEVNAKFTRAATTAGGELKIWDLQGRKLVASYPMRFDRPKTIRADADFDRLALVCSEHGTIETRDLTISELWK